jgi:transposase-like protein
VILGCLEAEINEHLGYPKHDPAGKNSGNSRNGFSRKTLKTNLGEVPLDVPRDRNATFEPVVVPRHERMSAKIEHAIITMYSRGMTTRDIETTGTSLQLILITPWRSAGSSILPTPSKA